MKLITSTVKKAQNGTVPAIMAAVNATLESFDMVQVTGWKFFAGTIPAVNTETSEPESLSIYKNGDEFFATPDFALDWIDGEWAGIGSRGTHFTISGDCGIIIED